MAKEVSAIENTVQDKKPIKNVKPQRRQATLEKKNDSKPQIACSRGKSQKSSGSNELKNGKFFCTDFSVI